ncbi:MAG: oligopeptide ABC transporter ATP-binding protein OppF [Chloroflexi bacterium]|nr:oligopeptide ABC transporter ATP-binding protein OppF [Chloroflexota bacterium]|tara:strand:- start:634 stop:1611 length:978 start_codon:yes stop_codon:yes gene_type:complete
MIKIEDLKVYYNSGYKKLLSNRNEVKAVDGVNLEINSGETLGLVGESGSGKSTIARAVLRLVDANNGKILIDDENLLELKSSKLRKKQREIGAIFQDPYSSLNPRMKVKDIISEPLKIHGVLNNSSDIKNHINDLLEKVGLNSSMANRYPHEFSGGQRQRIGIARAIATKPKLIVCDEPVSALDVSVQAQILNLLKKLQKDTGITYLFIAHDLAVVKYLSTRIAVMYLGKIVEYGETDTLFSKPQHPYTKALIDAIPSIDPQLERTKPRNIIQGDIPSATNPPSGCVFRTRCPKPTNDCKEGNIEMGLIEVSAGHWVDKCCINCN